MALSEDALKGDLLSALNALQTTGSFAGSIPVSPASFPNPYLECIGVGPIALPLDEAQARQLIEKASQVAPRKGTEATVGSSVGSAWELNASQLEMRNPAWPQFIQAHVESIKLNLGVNGPVHADLDRMFIYEKGATFEAHAE
jgi:hypothetical protein